MTSKRAKGTSRAVAVSPAPLPRGFKPERPVLDDGAFGAFSRRRALGDDGRIVAVATPGHISVICIDDHGRHVMLAGDVSDTLEQLHARRATPSVPIPPCTARRCRRSSPTAPSTRPSTCRPTIPGGGTAARIDERHPAT